MSIDNGVSFRASDGDVTIKDSKIYGELKENMECYPYGTVCSCLDLEGIFVGVNYVDSNIIGFDNYTQGCGGTQQVVDITKTKLYQDEIPFFELTDMLFTDLSMSAFAKFGNPRSAPSLDCGPFECTGFYNGAFLVTRARFTGSTYPTGLPSTFMVVSDNKLEGAVSTQVFPGCRFIEAWNANLCIEEKIGQLVFESMDPDKKTRLTQPVYVTNEELGYSNKLNAYASPPEEPWEILRL